MPSSDQRSLDVLSRPVGKAALKRLLGEVPLAAELYWQLRQRGEAPIKSFSMHRIEQWLPEIGAQAQAAAQRNLAKRLDYPRKRILLFATLRYWIEYSALLSLTLAGLGHQVTMLYLPLNRWDQPSDRFDSRRLNAYAHKILSMSGDLVRHVSLLDIPSWDSTEVNQRDMAPSLINDLEEVSLRDTQYTQQVEEIEQENRASASGRLYQLRLARNLLAARSVLTWWESLDANQRPELLITPNGSILEMGAVYQLARHLEIPVLTFEFGEQRGRIWLAKDAEVMHQETDDLWQALKDTTLSEAQWERVRALYTSRQNASLWENFSRLWQGLPSQGGEKVRLALGLDNRPVVLLAANVIGDSLTLGRQIFSRNMTEWLQRTVQMFTQRPDVQLVIRIHPGERYTKGPSVAQVVQNASSTIPANIHLIQALDPINTYDLLEIADLGLAYTTTVGMEMAMSGVPVIVSGATHYRGKGFTLDPCSWEDYSSMLQTALSDSTAFRMDPKQVEIAWHYAYHFYFDYPCPFPWHLLDYWDSLKAWPMERALSAEGLERFGDTYRYLAGERREWKLVAA
jgi:hypothetical protein